MSKIGRIPQNFEPEEIDQQVGNLCDLADSLPELDESNNHMTVLVHLGHHGLLAVSKLLPADIILDDDYNVAASDNYSNYMREAFSEIDEALQNDEAQVLGLYQEGWGHEYQILVGAMREEIQWVPTHLETSIPHDHGIPQLGLAYSQLEDESSVRLLGEDGEKCYQYALRFFSRLDDLGPKDLDIIQGPSYTC